MLAVSSPKLLLADMTSPAAEKTLSLGTEVAGMERYFVAN